MKFKFGENTQDLTKMAMMVAIIALMFFLLSPGVIWNFPEDKTCSADGTVNKINVVTHGVLFGIILVISYNFISDFVYKK